jgi:flagellar motor switch protein FliM
MTEILSQEEVDALLNAIQKGDVNVSEPPKQEEIAKRRVEPYDFHKPHLISNEQLRGLQIIHDNFAKGLQGGLSGMLRTALDVKLVAIDQLQYSEFVLSLYNPTFLTVMSLAPLAGNALIEMNLAIIMVIIDRLLGGTGVAVPPPRELTPIEMSVVRSVVRMALHEMQLAWEGTVPGIRFEVESHDFNPEFLRIAAPESSVLSVTFDWRIGETAGVINLCYPFSLIKPVLPKLSTESVVSKAVKEPTEAEKKKMLRSVGLVPMTVHAVLGRSILTADQVANLKVGDILCLENRFDNPIHVVIEGKPCYRAEIGQRHEKMAVRLLAVARAEDVEVI